MRWIVSVVVAGVTLSSGAARGQEMASPQTERAMERNQLSLEMGVLSGMVGYARRVSPNTLVGGAAGVGFQVLSHVFAGEHFSDGNNSRSFDFLEGRLFLRQELSAHWTLDAGLRASQVLHIQGGDLEVSDHSFVGAYATPMFGWRLFQLGPTLSAGVFSREAGPERPAQREFGVRLTGVTGRFTFRF